MYSATATASDASRIITTLTRHDILMGRGAPLAYYEGNVWFRDLVAPWKDLYTSTKLQEQKQEIAMQLYVEIGKRNGRFLAKAMPQVQSMEGAVPTANTTQWVIVSEDKALEKIKQALREKSHVPAMDAPIPTTSPVQVTVTGTSDNGDDPNGASIPTSGIVPESQRKQKRRRNSPHRRRVASTASAPPSRDSNFNGIALEQQQQPQQRLLEPSRFAIATSATLEPALHEAQRLRSVEMLRRQLNMYEQQGPMPLQTPRPLTALPPPSQTLPLGTSSTASLPTMTGLAALLFSPPPQLQQQPQQQRDTVLETMLIRQREQRLRLEMLQQRQHQQLSWQQQQPQQHHLGCGGLLFPGPTLQPNYNPFLASNGDSASISSLWMPPVLLDRDAAWGRSLLPNERIQLSRLAPEVAADAAPNRDAAFFGLLSSPTTVATGSHPSNHTTTDSGTNVAMGALATTNDDDDDADKNCKQARH